MKKAIYYISAILLGFTSCTKDEVQDVPITYGVKQVANNLLCTYSEATRLVQLLEIVDKWDKAETSTEKTNIVNRYFGELTAIKNYGDSIVISDFGTIITGGTSFNDHNVQWIYKEPVHLVDNNNMITLHVNTFTVHRKGVDNIQVIGKDLYWRYLKNSYSYMYDVKQNNDKQSLVEGVCDMESGRGTCRESEDVEV